jgi:hypothetical protein
MESCTMATAARTCRHATQAGLNTPPQSYSPQHSFAGQRVQSESDMLDPQTPPHDWRYNSAVGAAFASDWRTQRTAQRRLHFALTRKLCRVTDQASLELPQASESENRVLKLLAKPITHNHRHTNPLRHPNPLQSKIKPLSAWPSSWSSRQPSCPSLTS